MDRINKSDLLNMEAKLKAKYGYRKYACQGRYGYIGIDEFSKDGGCLNTYRTGLTKKEAYYCLNDLFNG